MPIGIHKTTSTEADARPAGDYCNGASCATEVTRALGLVTGRWAVPVLEAMYFARGPVRFREIQRRIGAISQKELTRQLSKLAHHGVAVRRSLPGASQRVEYELSAHGISLMRQLDALGKWVQAADHSAHASRASGGPAKRAASWLDALR
jgi:DNA-binding HxlR family transcriptional regulator